MAGSKPVTNPRIVKLIELEAAGRIKPEHQVELDAYRARGLAPKGEQAGSEQGKAGNFYRRAAGANQDYESTDKGRGEGPRGMVRQFLHNRAPDLENTFLNGDDRQVADAAQRDFIAATLRYESGAAIPPEEFDSQYRIFFPVPGDGAAVIEQKKRARARALEGLKAGAGPAARGVEQEEQRRSAGAATASPPTVPPASALGRVASPDGSGTFSTERDRAFAAEAQALFDKGASRADMDRLALQYGAPRYGSDLDKAIAFRDGGGKGARIAPSESGTKGPSLLGALAATAPGAAIAGAANAVTGGTLDEIAGALGGDQEQAQLAKEVMAADHPYAYTGGQIGGTIAASLGAGGLAGRALPAASRFATGLLGDAAYGAAYGAGESNDDRLAGAAMGAGAAAAGNLAGNAVVRGVAGAVAPTVNADVRFLRDAGVRTTLGQSLGPTASRLEEKLVSIPVLGDLIRSGRQRALGDFNRGVMNDALGRLEPVVGNRLVPEGVEGTAAMAHGQQAFDDAYDVARANMQLVPDAQLATDLTDLSQRVASGQLSEASANRLATIYDAEVGRRLRGGGPLSGDVYKRMSSRLGALRRSTRSSDAELSDALGEMQSIIDTAARRSSPAEAAAQMDAVDEGYALWTRVENAARMRGGDTGAFTPSQLDAAVQRADGSVRSRSYLRGDALGQRWSEAGKNILRDTVPNSGTADRIAAGGVLAGAGFMSPATIAPFAAGTVAYAPGVRDALSALVASERPAIARATADALRGRSYLGGATGSALTLDALAFR